MQASRFLQFISQLICFQKSRRVLSGGLLIFAFSFLAAVSIPNSGLADFAIQDDQNILQELAYRLPAIPFQEAMTCPQNMKFSATKESCDLKCNSQYCTTSCAEPAAGILTFNLGTEECTGSSVAIYGSTGGVSNGFAVELSSEDYLAGGNTWLIGLLRNLGKFIKPEGTVILKNIRHRMFTELVNGKQQTFFAPVVSAEIQLLPNTKTVGIDIGIDTRSSGLNQILIMQLDDQDVFLKRKGILNVSH